MSNLIYTKQSFTELEFKLFFASDLDYGFNVLKNKMIEWQDVKLEFSIIGSSHFVKINTGNNNRVIELIACVQSEDIIAKNIIEQEKLTRYIEYKCNKEISPDYLYCFYTELIEDRVENHREFKNRYIDNVSDIYLEYIFPSSEGLAITSIEIYQNIDRLYWVTYHSYPEEKKIIKTRSVIEGRSGK